MLIITPGFLMIFVLKYFARRILGAGRDAYCTTFYRLPTVVKSFHFLSWKPGKRGDERDGS